MSPWERKATLIAAGVLALLLLLWIIRVRESLFMVLTPFLAALILAYILAPAIRFMERRGISRPLGIAVIYLLFAILVFVICVRVIPHLLGDIQELAERLPDYAAGIQKFIHHLQDDYRRFNLPPNVREVIDNNIQGLVETLTAQLEHAYNFLIDLFGRVLLFLLVPVLTYYFLRDEAHLKDVACALFPRRYRKEIIELAAAIDEALGALVRGTLLVSVAVGVLSYLGFLLIGLKFSLFLAIIVVITNLIPYIGPIIGAVPAVLVALLDSPLKAMEVVILLFAMQQVESYLITPYVIGRSVKLHPLLIILVLLIGGKLYGLAGLILALPVAIMIRIMALHLLRRLF